MRKDVAVRLGPGDRERLEAVLADRNSAQKHVWRARIILATAEGCGTSAGMRATREWRKQRRRAGCDAYRRQEGLVGSL